MYNNNLADSVLERKWVKVCEREKGSVYARKKGTRRALRPECGGEI